MADVRSLYARFGVTLPQREDGHGRVRVRCFLGGHKDRRASAMVNLRTGGFNCHACNIGGGVLDALAWLGEPDRDRARQLAIEYGILDADARARRSRQLPGLYHPGPGVAGAPPTPVGGPTPRATPTLPQPGAGGPTIDWANLTPPATARERVWEYVNEAGTPVGRVKRLDLADGSKRIWQERPTPAGWDVGLAGRRLPLYRLPQVLHRARRGSRVLVVEGEKAVDALDRLALFATTNAGGAGKWHPEYTAALRGARVTVIADCDTPGRQHALSVTQELLGAGVNVTTPLDPAPYHHDGFDIVDYLAGCARTIRSVEPDFDAARVRTMLVDHVLAVLRNCLPAHAGELREKSARLRERDQPLRPGVDLFCERCGQSRRHSVAAGLAYCPCGGHQPAPEGGQPATV
jgi:hypothetical protein